MHYNCPYPEELLEEWDGACNPMGSECNDCEDYDCEHNPNPDPSIPWYDPYEVLDGEERERAPVHK